MWAQTVRLHLGVTCCNSTLSKQKHHFNTQATGWLWNFNRFLKYISTRATFNVTWQQNCSHKYEDYQFVALFHSNLTCGCTILFSKHCRMFPLKREQCLEVQRHHSVPAFKRETSTELRALLSCTEKMCVFTNWHFGCTIKEATAYTSCLCTVSLGTQVSLCGTTGRSDA